MDRRYCRILILDTDAETLITLERILQDAGCDTTTTWSPIEARQLFEGSYFDFLIVGDHPPELDAAMILRDVQGQGCCGACLVMLPHPRSSEVERFGALGAVAVISKEDHPSVLELVRKHSKFQPFRPKPSSLASTEAGEGRPAIL